MQENNRNAGTPAEPQTAGKPSLGQRISALTMKQWVLFSITAFTAIFMFIGLAFPIWAFRDKILGTVLESTVLGFYVLGGTMPQALESVATMLMAFVWLQLLATVVCIVLAVLSLTAFPQKKAGRMQCAVMIISTLFAFLYMIDGIAAVSGGTLKGTTASYALFIVVVLLTVGYFICRKVLPESAGSKKSKQGGGARRDNDDVVAGIKMYKDLYDMGAITAEEFEKKKSELLNGKE